MSKHSRRQESARGSLEQLIAARNKIVAEQNALRTQATALAQRAGIRQLLPFSLAAYAVDAEFPKGVPHFRLGRRVTLENIRAAHRKSDAKASKNGDAIELANVAALYEERKDWWRAHYMAQLARQQEAEKRAGIDKLEDKRWRLGDRRFELDRVIVATPAKDGGELIAKFQVAAHDIMTDLEIGETIAGRLRGKNLSKLDGRDRTVALLWRDLIRLHKERIEVASAE